MATYSARVPSGNDNGYMAGSWQTNPSAPGIGKAYLGNDVYSAWRFQNVNIPQGTTITSATLKITASENDSSHIVFRVYGLDEDDTATLTSDPGGRSKTSAYADWDINTVSVNTVYSKDVTSIVQEIINRAGWASGNHLGFITVDNGSSNDNIIYFVGYGGDATKCALLEIAWGGPSASASVSPSHSVSPSVSPSLSPSASMSPSASPSPSPFPPPAQAVLKIAKPGVNVLENSDPDKLIFSSEYGTLKYYDKQTKNLTIDASAGDIACKGTITHNLGYYPFVEVFVSVYIGDPTGVYEYCPFSGAGATVFYGANIKLTTTEIELYGEILGMSSSLWHFDFLVFIYKNNLNL